MWRSVDAVFKYIRWSGQHAIHKCFEYDMKSSTGLERYGQRLKLTIYAFFLLQDAYAQYGVINPCLFCISKGCGYCFVQNRVANDNSSNVLLPGEPPSPQQPIAQTSQVIRLWFQSHSCRLVPLSDTSRLDIALRKNLRIQSNEDCVCRQSVYNP